MNLMRARFARAACGMSSRFASPRLIFRSRDFKAESCPGLNELWRSGFLATSSRARQPQQQSGCASLLLPWRRWHASFPMPFASRHYEVWPDAFRRFQVVWCPYPIENYGHTEAQDCPCVSGVGAQLAGDSYVFGRRTATTSRLFSFLGAAKTRRSCCWTWDGVHGRFEERQIFNANGEVQRLDADQVGQSPTLAPSGETAHAFVVGRRVFR